MECIFLIIVRKIDVIYKPHLSKLSTSSGLVDGSKVRIKGNRYKLSTGHSEKCLKFDDLKCMLYVLNKNFSRPELLL
jgi:hypothetical protein